MQMYQWCEVVLRNQRVFLLKPQTYMNLSGKAVVEFTRKKGILPENTLVIHDEVDLQFGQLKVKVGGGVAGHRGLKSIVELWSKDFIRLRMGVGRDARLGTADHVLKPQKKEDMELLSERGVWATEQIVSQEIVQATAIIHTKTGVDESK